MRLVAAGRSGEGASTERGVAGPFGRQPPVACEPPRPADEHAHVDPLGFRVGQRLDAAVLRPDRLRPAHDSTGVRIARPGAERGIDRRCTGLPHGREPYTGGNRRFPRVQASVCAGEDLNLHDPMGHKALNLARLPIPPPARAAAIVAGGLTPSAAPATLEHMFAPTGGAALLTKRQQEIWEFLVEYVDAHGYPPTVREIGEKVGLASPSTVHAHLANLERAGLIKRDPTKPRALELSGRAGMTGSAGVRGGAGREAGGTTHSLPLVGQIAAGGPLLAEQNVDAYISVPEPLSRGGEEFLLRVRGDSMVDAGILEGDYVVVRRQQDAKDGDIVVALVGDDESADEATVKRFFRAKGRVRLQPENDAYQPILASHVQILGKVTGVFRTL
jgi:repressor LexA